MFCLLPAQHAPTAHPLTLKLLELPPEPDGGGLVHCRGKFPRTGEFPDFSESHRYRPGSPVSYGLAFFPHLFLPHTHPTSLPSSWPPHLTHLFPVQSALYLDPPAFLSSSSLLLSGTRTWTPSSSSPYSFPYLCM